MFILAGALVACSFTACNDDDDDTVAGDIAGTVSTSTQTITVEWDDNEASIPFVASGTWTAKLKDAASGNWITLTVPKGQAGNIKMPMLLSPNSSITYREAVVEISSGTSSFSVTIHQNPSPNAVQTMDPSTIKDYDKFYLPSSYNPGFEKGAEGMLRSDARYSWFRMKQSEHFFVFWEPGFGDDPNAESVPAKYRVDIDDLLEKAEQFYKTNVETLKMVTTGEGKSQLDNYKMEIYLLYQEEWLATGSGYDNTIGALWVNPSTCKPVGSTIAHEIGHSFQYMVFTDANYRGEANEEPVLMGSGYIDGEKYGWRYGFGPDGQGGCAYWEQCAQWQSFQDYPAEAYTQTYSLWLANHHRHFNHEYYRYQSVWFQYYMTNKHGIESYGKLWQESEFPEDPLQTYARLYCDGNLETFWDNYYEFASHAVTYDFGDIQSYSIPEALNYSTKLYKVDGKYRPAYENCPEIAGFNVIPLNVPAAGTVVEADLSALAIGSALAADDPGNQYNDEAQVSGNASTYNAHSNNTAAYRFGFVAVKDGKASYGDMATGKSGKATLKVPECDQLYFVVAATPTTYHRHYWNSDDSDDEQFPYEVSFSKTDLLGTVVLDGGSLKDLQLSKTLDGLDAMGDWVLGSINLLNEGYMQQIAQAFQMQPDEIVALLSKQEEEGKIAVGTMQSDESVVYDQSANGYQGFWLDNAGDNVGWGPGTVFFEYDGQYSIDYGHVAGASDMAGQTAVMKPTFVYTKDGKKYTVTLTITMNF